MQATPLVTVVIPMFNSGSTILDTIESVLNQSMDSFDVVVIDDGSTDDSAALVDARAAHDSRLHLHRLRENQGHGPARNAGIKVATGDYLVFVDADDRLLPGALQHISEAVQSGQDLYFLGSVEKRRRDTRSLNPGGLLDKIAQSDQPWSFKNHPELVMWPPATWSKVYRREFLIHKGISFPTGYHQDIPWSVAVTIQAESIGAIPYDCYLYLRHGEGSSTTMSKGTKTLERIRQIQRVREAHDIDQFELAQRNYLAALMAVHLIWANRAAYRTIPEHLHEQFFRDSSAELSWWMARAQPGSETRSEPLMPTSERNFFTKALASNDFETWQQALRRFQSRLRWKRRLDPSRYLRSR